MKSLPDLSELKAEIIDGHILRAVIDRPAAQNAINFGVIDDLESLVEYIKTDNDISAFILTGGGNKTFIAGGDLKEFHTIKSKEEAVGMSRRVQALLLDIEALPVWTIACINGSAYGGGIEILLSFDFHIASSDVKFGFTQGRFYLSPGWGGLTRLIEKIGKSKAFQLLAESAVLTSEEVLDLRIIEKIAPVEQLQNACLDWAKQLTRNDRFFIEKLKESTLKGRKERLDQLENEIEPFTELWVHPTHEERVEKFINKAK